jgi:hypothetical protein
MMLTAMVGDPVDVSAVVVLAEAEASLQEAEALEAAVLAVVALAVAEHPAAGDINYKRCFQAFINYISY